MSRKAARIFQRMKRTKSGWRPQDFLTLYSGFGFIIVSGKKHDIVIHPDFPDILRDTIPRGAKALGPGYAKDAVKNIELLQRLIEQSEEADEASE